jgi:hypothetical protein
VTGDAPLSEVPPPHGSSSSPDVGSVYGPVAMGSGQQINTFSAPVRRRAVPLSFDRESEADLERVFVEPSAWSDIVAVAQRGNVVLLIGAPGSGRRTAARRLLATARRPDDADARELPAERDVDTGRFLEEGDVASDDRLLLDLSELDEHQFGLVQRELLAFRGVIRSRGALLVVIVPTYAPRMLLLELRAAMKHVSRPDAQDVFCRNVAAHSVTPPLRGDLPAKLVSLLDRAAMVDVAYLASLAHRVRCDHREPEWRTCLMKVVEAGHGDEQVAVHVRDHSDGRHRALLLAAALFTGSPVRVVLDAESLLLDAVQFGPAEQHQLERPDLLTRLDQIGARIEEDRVIFVALDQDSAIRRHFWSFFPELRSRFATWVVNCGSLVASTGAEGQHIVRRFVDECVRTRHPLHAVRAVKIWADDDQLVELAWTVLKCGLRNHVVARHFRMACYDWSRQAALPTNLVRLVVRACIEEMPVRFAVVRLHHLIRNGRPEDAEAACAALRTLAGQQPVALRWILARLIGEFDAGPARHPSDRWIFRRVADPPLLLATRATGRPLLLDPVVRRQLVQGWREVYASDNREVYEPDIRRWLDVHTQLNAPGALLSTLVEACENVRHWAAVYAIGHAWLIGGAGNARARRTTFARLEQEIDRARDQTPAPTTPTEEEDG